MVTLRCKKCGTKWQSKTPNPKRCGYYPCRTMLWNGRKRAPYRTHGRTQSSTYKTWQGMKQRCLNPANPRWGSYGGCGVTVCRRWMSFEGFLADMGERPEGKTLDRFPNPFGNYEPSNCRWATPAEQQNNMRANRILEHQGKRQSVARWANELGINRSTLAKRIARGWSVMEALGFQ